ncbi:MAG: hypothetical protein Q8M17_08595 [Actinomycetota bacterium]|nr:hypothetical protein [Actinomycetota bacterium]
MKRTSTLLLAGAAIVALAAGPMAVSATAGQVRATVTQWASTATATSQYGSVDWAARQATGAPNVSECADNGDAWASSSSTGYDKLTVGFSKAVVPSMVRIHVSYNPGQVTMVQVIDAAGTSTVIYRKAPRKITTCPYVMSIPVTGVTTPINRVRITVNQQKLRLGWTEIDAVQLVGQG